MERTKVNFTQNLHNRVYEFKNITVIDAGHKYYPTMMGLSQCVRQYMKQRYGKLDFKIETDTFAGGDSLRLFFNPLTVPTETVNELKQELEFLQAGTVDGMRDAYDYKKGETGFKFYMNGSFIKFTTKYLFIYHSPKHDSKEEQALEDFIKTVTHIKCEPNKRVYSYYTENGETYSFPLQKVGMEIADKVWEERGNWVPVK